MKLVKNCLVRLRQYLWLLILIWLVLVATSIGRVSCDDKDLEEAFHILKEYGLSDVAASAVVGNISCESGGSPTCVESGPNGKGIGIFQLSNNANRQSLEDFCSGQEHVGHTKVVLSPASAPKSYTVCDSVRCQIDATLPGIISTMDVRKWSSYYNEQVVALNVLANGVVSGHLPASIDVVTSWEGFKAQDDLMTAVIQFQCDYETPGCTKCFWVGLNSYNANALVQENFIVSTDIRYTDALKIYEAFHIEPVSRVEDLSSRFRKVAMTPLDLARKYEDSLKPVEPLVMEAEESIVVNVDWLFALFDIMVVVCVMSVFSHKFGSMLMAIVSRRKSYYLCVETIESKDVLGMLVLMALLCVFII